MADVTFEREEFTQSLPGWTLVDDVCEGERKIKEGGPLYLPIPNPADKSSENAERFKQYLARAVFYNATSRTLQGLTGAASKKAPEEEIGGQVDYVKTDIDGSGTSIYQQSIQALGNVLKQGRHALFVDYPNTEKPTSRAEQDAGNIRANTVSVKANQVINWKMGKVGGSHRLEMVVIQESAEENTSDGFGTAFVAQYRVLRMVGNVYSVEVWRKSGDEWVIFEEYSPTDSRGNHWDEIPFTFIGSENNDTSIDAAPLYDLAVLNVAHYRNSADYEDSAFFVGQAQPWIAGLDEEWRDHLEAAGLFVGSRAPILLPAGGAYGITQAQPNSIVKEAMDQKERQMVALGARLIERGQAVKTATEAQSDNESEHSVLLLAVENVSSAYTKALGWMARYVGDSSQPLYKINNDFSEYQLEAQMLTALVGAWQSGTIPSSDFWQQMRKFGVIPPGKDDEQIRDELEADGTGLGLDDGG